MTVDSGKAAYHRADLAWAGIAAQWKAARVLVREARAANTNSDSWYNGKQSADSSMGSSGNGSGGRSAVEGVAVVSRRLSCSSDDWHRCDREERARGECGASNRTV
ncbi:hypothetical protein NL676_007408 [Syzygium grande]|nr:hypothetical protein NL676_007408 [Syzygium grande]